jgi:apolipoprotein N-acyltransferase
LLYALASPPLDLVLPAFLCLVPLARSVEREVAARGRDRQSVWRAVRSGLWFGVLAAAASGYWMPSAFFVFSPFATVGFLIYLVIVGGATACVGAALHVARRRGVPFSIALPVAWVTAEVVLGAIPDLSFTGYPLGLAIARVPLLAQIVDVSGVHTASFWIALTNGLFADALLETGGRRALARRLVTAVAVSLAVVGYGALRMRSIELRPLATIAAVQPNMTTEEKQESDSLGRARIAGALGALTRVAVRDSGIAMVVWPETALPDLYVANAQWADSIRAIAGAARVPIMFGTIDVEAHGPGDVDLYNAVLLAGMDGQTATQAAYRKRFLVPIVERIPLFAPSWFGLPRAIAGYGIGGVAQPFRLSFGRVGVLICYESTFAQRAREQRLAGADLLVNVTNDAWLGRGLAPYQHEAHVRLRAIENRVGVLRVGNTGVTEFVDALGRSHGATALFEQTVRRYATTTSHATTLYLLLGDWLGLMCTIAAIALCGWALIERRRTRG